MQRQQSLHGAESTNWLINIHNFSIMIGNSPFSTSSIATTETSKWNNEHFAIFVIHLFKLIWKLLVVWKENGALNIEIISSLQLQTLFK